MFIFLGLLAVFWVLKCISFGCESSLIFIISGLEIATDTVANASATFNLANKNSSLVATLATMFL